MAISVSDFGVDVGCPGNLTVGQEGQVQASMQATVQNDGDEDEVVNYSLQVADGEGGSASNSSSASVPAGGSIPIDIGAGFPKTYLTPAQRTVTASGSVGSESQSTTCTFSVLQNSSRQKLPASLPRRRDSLTVEGTLEVDGDYYLINRDPSANSILRIHRDNVTMIEEPRKPNGPGRHHRLHRVSIKKGVPIEVATLLKSDEIGSLSPLQFTPYSPSVRANGLRPQGLVEAYSVDLGQQSLRFFGDAPRRILFSTPAVGGTDFYLHVEEELGGDGGDRVRPFQGQAWIFADGHSGYGPYMLACQNLYKIFIQNGNHGVVNVALYNL